MINLHAATDPVVEMSSGLTVRPYNGDYDQLPAHAAAAGLDMTPQANKWDRVRCSYHTLALSVVFAPIARLHSRSRNLLNPRALNYQVYDFNAGDEAYPLPHFVLDATPLPPWNPDDRVDDAGEDQSPAGALPAPVPSPRFPEADQDTPLRCAHCHGISG